MKNFETLSKKEMIKFAEKEIKEWSSFIKQLEKQNNKS